MLSRSTHIKTHSSLSGMFMIPNHLKSSFNKVLNIYFLLVYFLERYLLLDGISVSCCFYSYLVLSGNVRYHEIKQSYLNGNIFLKQDGSVCVWDTRESENIHKVNMLNNSKETVMRSPTYNTGKKKIFTLQLLYWIMEFNLI